MDSEHYGGNENLEAIDFLRRINELVHKVPGAMTIAEESTAFPGRVAARVSERTGVHDEVEHGLDARHARLTSPKIRSIANTTRTTSRSACCTHSRRISCCRFRTTKWFMARRALIGKMPGDEWQRFANARAFLAYMYAHPGKKLLFMGSRSGRPTNGTTKTRSEWWLLDYEIHRQFQTFFQALNQCLPSRAWRSTKWIFIRRASNGSISTMSSTR